MEAINSPDQSRSRSYEPLGVQPVTSDWRLARAGRPRATSQPRRHSPGPVGEVDLRACQRATTALASDNLWAALKQPAQSRHGDSRPECAAQRTAMGPTAAVDPRTAHELATVMPTVDD